MARDAARNDASDGLQRSLPAQVARRLGLRIVSGEYAAGAAIPVGEMLSAEFGVGRSVQREAVKVLVAKGLLDARPRRGTLVRPKSEWNLLDPDVLLWHYEAAPREEFLGYLWEVRWMVEPRAAATAARRAGEAHLEAIRQAYEGMCTIPPGEAAHLEADLAFHTGLLRATENPFLGALGAAIETALRMSLELSSGAAQDYQAALHMHGRVLEAVAAGRPEAAEAAMHELLTASEADVQRGISP